MAEQAGTELLKRFRIEGSGIRGSDKGIKTVYDTLSDTLIKRSIEREFPTHSYLTEETGWVRKEDSDSVWIVDPLDGTSNYVNHNPFFAVSIAFWHKGMPLVSVIEAPMLQERFVAVAGKGGYREDLLRRKRYPLRVSSVGRLADSYWVFCQGGEKTKDRTMRIFDTVYPAAREFRKIGSAAVELAMVASGRADGYVTTNISFWDIAAGMLLVKEAGGQLARFDGTAYRFPEFFEGETFDLVATNGKVKMRF